MVEALTFLLFPESRNEYFPSLLFRQSVVGACIIIKE